MSEKGIIEKLGITGKIVFKGNRIEGEIPFSYEMVCIPSKDKYSEVDLCLKDGMNIQIAEINGKSATFESRKELGYEIEKRWNSYYGMLNTLIEDIIDAENTWINNFDYNMTEKDILIDCHNANQNKLNIVEKATSKSWSEIKALL